VKQKSLIKIIEFEMKDTTDKIVSASFLDIPVEIDWGQVKNETMTRDDFNFRIANFQLQCMCSSTCSVTRIATHVKISDNMIQKGEKGRYIVTTTNGTYPTYT
jgi:hypothetical protein